MTRTPDQASEQFAALVGSLPEALRDKLRALTEQPLEVLGSLRTPAEPAVAPLPLSRAVLTAAISDTFTLTRDRLAPGGDVSDETLGGPALTEDERAAILEHSEGVLFAGRRRLRLLPNLRGDILRRASDLPEYRALLDAAYLDDMVHFEEITNDEPRRQSAWLRCFLKGEDTHLEQAPASELRSAVAAREALAFAPLPDGVPSLADTRRLLDRAELLEPLRLLIGARGGWDGSVRSDRFIGRSAEIRMLRSFVDELASESTFEMVSRGTGRAVRGLSQLVSSQSTGVLMIEARGGLGKSSLMAKFVLDHALDQVRPFPFVYLDFDRASLQARDPRQLILETARQVALQFPKIATEIDALRGELRDALSSRRVDTAGATPQSAGHVATRRSATISEFVERFCKLMRERVTEHGERAFLLVLDTLEIVQYDNRALQGLLSFVDGLFDFGFPELRVVASGRADVPDLVKETRSRRAGTRNPLKALTVNEAAAMADRLGRDLLGDEWDPVWAGRVAGAADAQEPRREPLSVRVAVELLRAGGDREERDRLSKEIASDGERVVITSPDGTTIQAPFVASLYLRRVLDHVRDKEARKLAWPGLLMRRITREMIDEFLGVLCELDPKRTSEVFTALGNEVWIVDKVGDALRHRPDLRARTLPLMRQHNPELFDRINNAAIRFFAPRAASDTAARAEWIYHRLLGGEKTASVDGDWTDDITSLLMDATDDFEFIVQRSAQYVLTKTASHLLPPARLLSLPPEMAFEHVARTAPHLGEFEETLAEPALLALSRLSAVSRRDLSDVGAAVQTVVRIKTGRWDDIDDDAGTRAEPWASLAAYATKYWQARTLNLGGASDVAGELQAEYGRSYPDSAYASAKSGRDPLTFLAPVQDMAAARILNLPVISVLEKRLVDVAYSRHFSSHTDFAALATAIIFGGHASFRMLDLWLNAGSPVNGPATISRSQILALTRNFPSRVAQLKSAAAPALNRLGLSWSEFAAAKDPDGPLPPMRIADDELPTIVRGVVQDIVRGSRTEREVRNLRGYFAARDLDWIVPFGYAAARLLDGREVPGSVVQRMQSYDVGNFSSAKERRAPAETLPTDFLKIMQLADEAGDLGGMAAVVLAQADLRDAAAYDFRTLVDCHRNWRKQVEEILASDEKPEGSVNPRLGRAPDPAPIRNPDDIQSGRWGRQSERDGRALSAKVTDVKQRYFFLDIEVTSTDGTPLEGPVVFHLDESYPRSIIHIRKIRDGSRAVLEEVSAYEVYTVGAQVKNGSGLWIGLELNLATMKDLPVKFRKR
jgi:hypothetical protein